MVARAKRGADQNARTQAHAVDEEDGQRHQRVGGADGGQGFLAHKFAHDDAVGGVVCQLEQIAQHEGNGEFDQQRGDRAGRHVFCHGVFSSFFFLIS